MEREKNKWNDVLFLVMGLFVIISMFANWFPINVDFGIPQLNVEFGVINGFTLCGKLIDMKEAFGTFGVLLPESFQEATSTSRVILACAVATILLYIGACALHFIKDRRYADVLSVAAPVCAIVTATMFRKTVLDFYAIAGVQGSEHLAGSMIMRSMWMTAMVAAVISLISTEYMVQVLASALTACVNRVISVVSGIGEWIRVLTMNIGYVISDVLGLAAGICIGMWLNNAAGNVVLTVIGSLAVTGIVAAVCGLTIGRFLVFRK